VQLSQIPLWRGFGLVFEMGDRVLNGSVAPGPVGCTLKKTLGT